MHQLRVRYSRETGISSFTISLWTFSGINNLIFLFIAKHWCKSRENEQTYWVSFLFFFWGSISRRVSLMTATFTFSSTGLGTFSNTPGESFTSHRDTVIHYRTKGDSFHICSNFMCFIYILDTPWWITKYFFKDAQIPAHFQYDVTTNSSSKLKYYKKDCCWCYHLYYVYKHEKDY